MGYTKRNKRCILKEGMSHASACQKIKRCIPKEGMPHAHKARQKKRKNSPNPTKRKTRERWFMQRSSSTIHQKYPHTCTSWSRVMTYFSFGSCFWLSKIWEASLSSYPPCLELHQIEALGVGWKERHKNRPWWGIMHLWAIREIIEELHIFFSKIL